MKYQKIALIVLIQRQLPVQQVRLLMCTSEMEGISRSDVKSAIRCRHCANKFLGETVSNSRTKTMKEHDFYKLECVWFNLANDLMKTFSGNASQVEVDKFTSDFLGKI